MKNLKLLLVLFIIPLLSNSQMLSSLSLPALGGGTNAHAATYGGDGVTVGTIGLFSAPMNATIGALSWNTGWNVLGGKYSVGIAQPVIWDGRFKNNFIPVSVITPAQISWDLNKLKLQGSYSFLFGHELPLNGHLFSIKATQYLNDGAYSINGGIIYEYRAGKKGADRTYGDALVLETNISKHFKEGQTAGFIAYYNSNVSPEYFGNKSVFNENAAMCGIGVDFSTPIGKHLFLNTKLIYDLSANEAIRANKIMVSLFYKF